MVLDVYFKEDLKRMIMSHVFLALKVSAISGCASVEHVQGILSLAHCQAICFGLNWKEMVEELKDNSSVSPLLVDIFVDEIPS
jgi:hypothetical protein